MHDNRSITHASSIDLIPTFEASQTSSALMKKGKLLIIDDNEDILFALNLLLEPYMEQIRVATQPERIDHFMRTFIPDIILLDMNFKRDAIVVRRVSIGWRR